MVHSKYGAMYKNEFGHSLKNPMNGLNKLSWVDNPLLIPHQGNSHVTAAQVSQKYKINNNLYAKYRMQ